LNSADEINIIYPEEFANFLLAMSDKMRSKRAQKGDSWKEPFIWFGERSPAYPMDDFLKKKLKEEITEYFKSFNDTELLDIANCCAMLWCRKNKEHTVKLQIVSESGLIANEKKEAP